MPYPNKQAAVDVLAPGWRITGEAPNMVTVPNPRGGEYGQPAQIQEQQGTILTIDNPAVPNEQPDTIIIKQVGNAPWKGGVGYDVVQGPTRAQPKPDKTATPPSGLIRLDKDYNQVGPGQAAVYIVDPQAPPGTPPYKIEAGNETGDPSGWTVVPADPNDKDGPKLVYDPTSKKVIATVPATAGTRASGEYVNIPDPNEPSRIIGLRDTGSNQIFPVSRNPDIKKQVVTTPTKILVLNDDGTIAQTHNVDPNTPMQAVVVDNQVWAFDPKTGTFTKGPEGTEAATLSIDTTAEWLTWYDKQGKEVSRVKNPSYRPPRPTIPSPNTVAPQIQIEDPDNPGKLIWIKNEGQLTIGEATQNLIKSLTGQTVDPSHPMTLDEAKTIIETAVAKMNAEAQQAQTATTAASTALQTAQQGAATGAGILNQRAATAQNLVQSGLNLFQGNRDITMPLPGIGRQLTQGAAAFATELGGGQDVYDTAARLVKNADPSGSNPLMSAAAATLTQIMDRYKQATGQDHPLVQATAAAKASQSQNALVAPGTPVLQPAAVAPAVFQAQFDPRFNPASPQQPVNTVLPAGVAGTVAPNDPRRLGLRDPMAGFIAPETLVGLLQGQGG